MYQITYSEVIDILLYVLIGLLIPLAGTVAGSSLVVFLKKAPDIRFMTLLDSLAAGVMCAASFFSLISPACEKAEGQGALQLFLCSLGFFSGIILFVIITRLTEMSFSKKADASGRLLMTAVTIHNIPEGMAVGIVYAGLISTGDFSGLSAALSLSLGIALQNIPEGAIISMPLKAKGQGTKKAFMSGFISGVAELIPAILTLFLFSFVDSILSFSLCFAAGAMFFVVLRELSSGFHSGKNRSFALAVFAAGFTLMMLLDTFFG